MRARTVGVPASRSRVAFGCPFEGAVDPDRVVELAERLAAAEPDELVLADTIGVATPTQSRRLVERVAKLGRPVGGHFHNTRNTGFANAYAALEGGVSMLDASVGGLGGCPFAPKATGNIATEDLVYLLEGEGIETGIDLEALIAVSEWLEGGARPAARRLRLPRRPVQNSALTSRMIAMTPSTSRKTVASPKTASFEPALPSSIGSSAVSNAARILSCTFC